jgi:phage protein U
MLETLRRLAPELAVMLAYAIREGINNARGAAKVNRALLDTQIKILEAAVAQETLAKAPPPPPKKEDYEKQAAAPHWGALGGVHFDVLSAPTKLSVKEGAAYVQHKVIGAKPHVQFAAPLLRTVTLALSWHSMLMDDIGSRHGKLLGYMQAQKVLPLVLGGRAGTCLNGLYVITSMPYDITRISGGGSVQSMELTLELLEWNTGGPLEPGEHAPPEAVKTGGGNTPSQSAGASKTNDDMSRK